MKKEKMQAAFRSVDLFQPQNNQYLQKAFFPVACYSKIREFEWEISFGLMKSGVCREMVITL